MSIIGDSRSYKSAANPSNPPCTSSLDTIKEGTLHEKYFIFAGDYETFLAALVAQVCSLATKENPKERRCKPI